MFVTQRERARTTRGRRAERFEARSSHGRRAFYFSFESRVLLNLSPHGIVPSVEMTGRQD